MIGPFLSVAIPARIGAERHNMGGWVVGVRGKGSRSPAALRFTTNGTVFTCLRATSSGTSFRNLGSCVHRLLLSTVHD